MGTLKANKQDGRRGQGAADNSTKLQTLKIPFCGNCVPVGGIAFYLSPGGW